MTDNFHILIVKLGKTRVLLNESLAKYSSFRIGGPADLFYRATKTQELIDAIYYSRKFKVPYFVIGGGTNLLIGDRGFRGLVIKNDSSSIKIIGVRGGKTIKEKVSSPQVHTVYVEVDSGIGINRLVRFALDQGFSGIEGFLGQPGTVGGALYINAHNVKIGCYFGDKVISAKLLNLSGEVVEVAKSYFHFSYDQSSIQKTKDIVLSIILKLSKGSTSELWKKAHEVLSYRNRTQPTGFFSSGCTFRNISKSEAVRISTPNFICSAGYILESLGLRGLAVGGARFSNNHVNFIIHKGNAKATDVLELIKIAKQKAKSRYNLDLKEEILLVGDF